MKQTIKRILPRSIMQAYETECRKETHINRALSRSEEKIYAEIGVHEGVCIRKIKALKKTGIDPKPINPDDIELDGTDLFKMTSDQFFESEAENWLGKAKINVALIDGLHEFKQALRDFQNLEHLMKENGVIFIHDCNPPSRSNEEEMGGLWMGDVWKVPLYLTECRSDLNFFTLDCDWGLGVVTGFSASPSPPDTGEISRIKALDYDFLDKNRRSILKLRNPLYSRLFFNRIG